MPRKYGLNDNIVYVEPNDMGAINSSNKDVNGNDSGQFTKFEMAPNLEDFCIAVDMKVEILSRGEATNGGNPFILCSWDSKDGSCSFFKGRTYRFGNNNPTSFLSTDAYDFATYQDIIESSSQGGTNECFGIKNVSIEYNSFTAPIITVEFTDIRGISLFAPEELRHSAVSSDGMGGQIDYSKDIAGSFFKSFFTFPSPRYTFLIKGFYGEPVTYEVACLDFKAKFDAKTGSFGATVKFVGYAYSVLGDVAMSAVITASDDSFAGSQYWENQISAGRFKLSNGDNMPRISTILEKVKEWYSNHESDDTQNNTTNTTSISTSESAEVTDANRNKELIQEVLSRYNEYLNAILKSDENNIKGEYNDNVCQIVYAMTSDSEPSEPTNFFSQNAAIKEAYDVFRTALYAANNDELNKFSETSYKFRTRFEFEADNNNNDATSGVLKIVQNVMEPSFKAATFKLATNEDIIALNLKDKFPNANYFWIANANAFYSKLRSLTQDSVINANTVQAVANAQVYQELVDGLGFQPTVENIVAILMAHFETFAYMLYKCNETIVENPRTPSDIGLSKTDLRSVTNGTVPAFPKVVVRKTNANGIEEDEESWIGALSNGINQPEALLVNGILSAASKVNDVAQGVTSESSDNSANNSLVHLVCASDILSTNTVHPLGPQDIDYDDLSDLSARLGIRCIHLFGFNQYEDDAETLGKLDAENFLIHVNQKPSYSFIQKLCASEEVITSKELINVMKVEDGLIDVSKLRVWQSSNDKNQKKLIENSGSSHYFRLKLTSQNNGQDVYMLAAPFKYDNWDTVKKIGYGGCGKSDIQPYCATNNFKLTSDLKQEYIFEKDVNKIKNIAFDESLSYSKDLNKCLSFQESYKKYYEDGQKCRLFFPKMGSIEHGNWCLPKEKPLDLETKYFINKDDLGTNFDMNQASSRQQKSFSSLEDWDSYKNYTIGVLNGFDWQKDYSYQYLYASRDENSSVCGSPSYYAIKDSIVRKLVFLRSFIQISSDGLGGIKLSDVVDDIKNNNKPLICIPYMAILFIGGLVYYCSQLSLEIKVGGEIRQKYKDVFSLPQEILDKAKKEYLEWEKNGGVDLINAFNLHGRQNIIHKALDTSLTDKLDAATLRQEIYNPKYKFTDNYISLAYDCIRLYLREDSPNVQKLTELLLKPIVLVKLVTNDDYIKENQNCSHLQIQNGAMEKYINGFLTVLKTNFSGDYQQIANKSNNEVQAIDAQVNDNAKIGVYKYLKNIWDKWFSGTKLDDWKIERIFKENWHFIDCYYNNIGNCIDLNPFQFATDIKTGLYTEGYGLINFISATLAHNRFSFHCVQNFFDMNESGNVDTFCKLFEPIPYNKIAWENLNFLPHFVALYTYEPSSKLPNPNNPYEDDGFNLDEDLPIHITSKNLSQGYRIPAFGVSYGKQYQSYFKDIQVSMDAPMVTEAAIKANLSIAGVDTIDDKVRKMFGQDLFTVFSNYSYTCTVSMMGCPWIQPLMYFQLTNVPLFRGAYLVQKVTHNITPGNMDTVFKGVRMSKESIPKVKQDYTSASNSSSSGNGLDDMNWQYENAEVSNDCQWQTFYPYEESEGGWPNEELEMTLAQYETLKKHKFNQDYINLRQIDKNKMKMIDMLTAIACGEGGGMSKTYQQVIATIFFNLRKTYKDDFSRAILSTKTFTGWKNTDDYAPSGQLYQTMREIVREVLTKTPIILVGRQAPVLRNPPAKIWDKHQVVGSMQTQEITLEMVQKVTMVATNALYQNGGKENAIWHRIKYLFTLEEMHGGKLWEGVFCSGDNRILWTPQPPKPKTTETEIPSPFNKQLRECISSSLEKSKKSNVRKSDLTFVTSTNGFGIGYGNDCFKITSKKFASQKEMAQVFDCILQAYYNYFEVLLWVVNNDTKEYARDIIVWPTTDTKKPKKIGMVKFGNGKTFLPYTEGQMNEDFMTSLKKRYGIISDATSKAAIKECKNFTNIMTEADWEQKINNAFNSLTVASCGSSNLAAFTGEGLVVNLSTQRGYSWTPVGKSTCPPNKERICWCKPKSEKKSYENIKAPFKIWSPAKALRAITDEHYKNDFGTKRSGSACGSWVRYAIKNGIIDGSMPSAPNAACMWVNYLPKYGFKCIFQGSAYDLHKLEGTNQLQDGDIEVMAACDANPCGHVQMYNTSSIGWRHGTRRSDLSNYWWHADVAYRNSDVYNSPNPSKAQPVMVFRWGGQIG